MKKFYIVNDYKDLLSGKVIPSKVLDYLPMNMGYPYSMPIRGYNMSNIMPQTITSPLMSPVYPLSPLLPIAYMGRNRTPIGTIDIAPSANVTIQRTPLFGHIGPPIVKLSPLISQNLPGTIKIISKDNIYTLNIPYRHLRDVISHIYLNIYKDLDKDKPKVTFRIITPTLDTTVETTYEKMLEIVNTINAKYSDITYFDTYNKQSTLDELIAKLYKMQ